MELLAREGGEFYRDFDLLLKKEHSLFCRAHFLDSGNPDFEILFAWVENQQLQKIRDQENHRLMQILDHHFFVVVITDQNGRIEYANSCFEKVSGYKLAEVTGKSVSILKSGTVGEEFYKNLWVRIQMGEIWEGEFLNRKKDGGVYRVFSRILPLKNKNGVIRGFAAIQTLIEEKSDDLGDGAFWEGSFCPFGLSFCGSGFFQGHRKNYGESGFVSAFVP